MKDIFDTKTLDLFEVEEEENKALKMNLPAVAVSKGQKKFPLQGRTSILRKPLGNNKGFPFLSDVRLRISYTL